MIDRKLKKKAQLECANWDCGNCTGCTIYIDRGYLDRNNWAPVHMSTDSKKTDKECTVEDGCEYFDKFVIK